MPWVHKITTGPTRQEQLALYKQGNKDLQIKIAGCSNTIIVKAVSLDLGHKFSGILKDKMLTDNVTCRVSGYYDPYSQTGELKIEGPQFTP